MLVHALDADARALYLHHGLESSPTDPLHLMILITEIELAIRGLTQRVSGAMRQPV